jgi:hypothetical protein
MGRRPACWGIIRRTVKTLVEDDQIAIYDDFLPAKALKALQDAAQTQPFKFQHVPDIKPVYMLGGGSGLESSNVLRLSGSRAKLLPRDRYPADADLPYLLYPTHGPIDGLLDQIAAVARHVPRLVGRERTDWVALSGKTLLYPANTGLQWHDDAGFYRAAFAFYYHPEWNALWGGELLVAAPDKQIPSWTPRHLFSNRANSAALLRQGIGRYVMPVPNRLVLIGPGVHHMIARVTTSAGDHLRASVAGFFVSRKGLEILTADSL